MKINKLLINGYGKFTNKEIKLNDGLCVVYGKNETGKSTIQAFIKNMLFSFENKNIDKEGRLPDYKKYKPWNHESYKGAMEVTLDNNKVYRIEKDFTSKETKVYNQFLEDETALFEYNKRQGLQFGETIFKMDRSTFENTAFIRQAETKVFKKEQSEIFDRIINLLETGDEDFSVTNALKILNKVKTELGHKSTKGRLYNQTEKRLEELNNKKDEVESNRKKMLDEQRRKKELSIEITELEEDVIDIEKHMIKKNEQQQLRDTFNEKNRLVSKLTDYRQYVQQINTSNELLITYEKQKNKKNKLYEISNEEMAKKMGAAAHIKAETDGFNNSYNSESEEKLISIKTKSRRLIIGALVGIVLFTILSFIYLIAIGVTAICIGLLIYAIVISPKKKEFEQFHKREAINQQVTVLYKFVACAGYKCENNITAIEKTLQIMNNEKNEFRQIDFKIKTEQRRIDDYQKLADRVLEELNASTEKRVETRIELLEKELLNSGYVDGKMEKPFDYQKVFSETKVLLNEKKIEQAGLMTLLNAYWMNDNQLSILYEEIAEKEEILCKIEQEKQALEKAMLYISDAAKEIKLDVMPKINDKMSEIINLITNGAHSNLITGKDSKLNTAHLQEVKSIWEFSDGTIEQMYLALRIATTQLFSSHENLPLLIDEAFAFYDFERMKNTFDMLYKLKETKQIIIFTCKKDEYELAKTYDDISIIEI